MKKPFYTIILLTFSVALLAACGKPNSIPPEADTAGNAAPSSQAASAASSPSSFAASSSSAAPSSVVSSEPEAQQEHSVTGTIDDVAMSKIYLTLEDGRTLPFNYTTADISKWSNTRPGSRATIYYTGNIDGSDTATVVVTRVESVT